jgi:hypothetical protein
MKILINSNFYNFCTHILDKYIKQCDFLIILPYSVHDIILYIFVKYLKL